MPQRIFVSGTDIDNLDDALQATLMRTEPAAIGVAAAFVSIGGVERLRAILQGCGAPRTRLIAGTDRFVTHPEALRLARELGWNVRLGRQRGGIFHPKLIVGGQRFSRSGAVSNLSCVYVGSSNLTPGGLNRNIECGLIAEGVDCIASAADAFRELWNASESATARALRNYSARFALRARQRSAEEVVALEAESSIAIPRDIGDLRHLQPPDSPSVSRDFAVAAWTGLQSFTGEYRFQIEFPRDAGQVIRRLVGGRGGADGGIDVLCTDTEETLLMQYRYYTDNGMFRLNVPNDVPGVAWAREHREGLALVEQGPRRGAPLRLRILRPGRDARRIVTRSVGLGTWGRTRTRAYGWF